MSRLAIALSLVGALACLSPLTVPAASTPTPEPVPAASAPEVPVPPVEREPNFQPYIFWAYGLACIVLFFFCLWTLVQLRGVERKVEYLTDRFRRAHPDALPPESST